MHVWWRVAGISLSAGMRNRKCILFVWGDAGLWKRWIVIWWNRVFHLWNERCRMVDDQCMWWRECSKLNQQWDVMLRLNTWPNHQRTLLYLCACMHVGVYVCTHTHTRARAHTHTHTHTPSSCKSVVSGVTEGSRWDRKRTKNIFLRHKLGYIFLWLLSCHLFFWSWNSSTPKNIWPKQWRKGKSLWFQMLTCDLGSFTEHAAFQWVKNIS